MSLPDPVALSRAYFDAWNRHDLAGVAATLAPQGTYRDPFTPGPLGGEALGAYATTLLEGLPDAAFAYTGPFPAGAAATCVPWVLTGRHTGTFNGIPPTGRAVRLEGVDWITVGEGGITEVVGYFDSGTFLRQLGLNLVPQPG
jgi:steroid delta-isomerase-like uncharacterized protein